MPARTVMSSNMELSAFTFEAIFVWCATGGEERVCIQATGGSMQPRQYHEIASSPTLLKARFIYGIRLVAIPPDCVSVFFKS